MQTTPAQQYMKKTLVVAALQEGFLQMALEQLYRIFGDMISIRSIQLNVMDQETLKEGDTFLAFSEGIITMAKSKYPSGVHFIKGERTINIFNLSELIAINKRCNILAVNDIKPNTDDLIRNLKEYELAHNFFPYLPNEPLPPDIDYVITPAEPQMVPPHLTRVIDVGLRVVSLDTIFNIHRHFELGCSTTFLSKRYMKVMVWINQNWKGLGQNRYMSTWVGTQKDINASYTFNDLIVKSSPMKLLFSQARKMASRTEPIHLWGETGAGKKRIAQSIHNGSSFATGPFITINCAARKPKMLEKELFGWEEDHLVYLGLFETARGGTLCIEEINDFPLSLQPRLLQALSEKKIMWLGGSHYIDIHVRMITTSSILLGDLPEKSFYKELYFLITQFTLKVPSLNERQDDFPELIENYLHTHLNRSDITFSKESIRILKGHDWKGNLQEFYNVLLHMVVMGEKGRVITPESLPYHLMRKGKMPPPQKEKTARGNKSLPLFDVNEIKAEIEKYGFLKESLQILAIYKKEKDQNRSLGRLAIQNTLKEKGIHLSKQQLRLRLERIDHLGLLIVRIGRSGTTISSLGEKVLLKNIDLITSDSEKKDPVES